MTTELLTLIGWVGVGIGRKALVGPAFADLSSLQWVAVPWPATHTLQNSTQPPPVLVALKRTLTAWSKCPAKWKITESVASSNVSRASPPRMRLLPELGFSASSALTCSLSHSGYRSQGYLRMLLLFGHAAKKVPLSFSARRWGRQQQQGGHTWWAKNEQWQRRWWRR